MTTHTPEKKARKAEQMRGYMRTHKERHKARWLIRRAIEAGRLVRQPCSICGIAPAHAHHDDYSKPLEIRWLCPKHHREHHYHCQHWLAVIRNLSTWDTAMVKAQVIHILFGHARCKP